MGVPSRSVSAVSFLLVGLLHPNPVVPASQPAATTLFPFPAVAIQGAHGLAKGDYNHDGYPDVATLSEYRSSPDVPHSTTEVHILYGQCDGAFEIAQIVPIGDTAYDLESGDLDRDGDLDLIVVRKAPKDIVFLINRGDGQFEPPRICPTCTAPYSGRFIVEDFNADGYPDFAVSVRNSDTGLVLHLSVGIPFLYSQRFIETGSTSLVGLASGDFDADGKPDIVVAEAIKISDENGGEYAPAHTIAVVRNAGDGTFEPPRVATSRACYADSLATWDVDHDGDDDILATYSVTEFGDPRVECECFQCAIAYRSDPGPSFSLASQFQIYGQPYDAFANYASVVDLESDGQPEIIVDTVFFFDIPPVPFREPILSLDHQFGFQQREGLDYPVGELDTLDAGADGSLDLVRVGAWNVAIYPIGDDGRPGQPDVLPVPLENGALTAADIDLNGLTDLAFYDFDRIKTYLQLSPGEWILAGDQIFVDAFRYSIQFLDLDGEGLLEMVAETVRGVAVFRQVPSAGRYALSQSLAFESHSGRVKPWDPDGDGDTDLVLVHGSAEPFGETGAAYFLENDGHGNLSLRGSLVVPSGSRSILPADLDGDGLVDLVTASGGNPYDGILRLAVFKGLSPWHFQETQTIEASPGGRELDIAGINLDRDGRIEVVLSNPAYARLEVYRAGDGPRLELVQLLPDHNGHNLQVFDIDGDGLLDVVATGFEARSSSFTVHRNRGRGFLDPGQSYDISIAVVGRILFSDLDGDGNPEAYARDYYERPFYRSSTSNGRWSTQPSLNWTANAKHLAAGDGVEIRLHARGGRKSSTFDTYVAVVLPGGEVEFLTPDGWAAEVIPYVHDIGVEACSGEAELWVVQGDLPSDLAVGTYRLVAAITPSDHSGILDADTLILEVQNP